MSDHSLAYHTVVAAMRDRSRSDARARFAMAINAALAGHEPHFHYRRPAAERRASGWSAETVSKAVFDWLHTDLNPAVQSIRAARSQEAILGLYNVYNQSVPLGVRTQVHEGETRRSLVSAEKDDELCAAGSLAVLNWIGRDARAKLARPASEWMLTGWRTALYLGVERMASAQAARTLDEEGDMDLGKLSARLGSTIRTFQRQIAAEGLTVARIRMASRQTRALRLIQDRGQSLGQIALAAGYADQAHMARGFRGSSGLTPGQIARMLAA